MDENFFFVPSNRNPSPGPENQGAGQDQVGTTVQLMSVAWPDHVRGYPEQDSVSTLTRVMSPTDPTNRFLEANQSVLLGMQCCCRVCEKMTPDPSLCASCGIYGHAICIGVELFQGYAFCHRCYGMATAQYASMNDAHLQQEWHLFLSRQVISWRESARNAIGTSTSIGIAVGGAAATAAGAALAVAHGIVQGVSSAASGSGVHAALPPVPEPEPSTTKAIAIRRSNSTGDLSDYVSEVCPKCDLGQRKPHTYRGTCRGLPASVYFGPKGPKPIANVTSAPGTPTTEFPRRDGVDSTSAISIELARRAEEQSALNQGQYISPDELVDRLLAQGARRDLLEAAQGMAQPVPVSRTRALLPTGSPTADVPPSSFGSANSQVKQTFFPSRQGSPMSLSVQEVGGSIPVESPEVTSDADLKKQLITASI